MTAQEARAALSLPAPAERSPALVLRYDPESASRIAGTLAAAGHRVVVCDSFRELRERLRRGDEPAVVILTGGLGEPAARELLEWLAAADVRAPVLALAEPGERARAETLRRLGLDEVLEKPFDAAEVLVVVRGLLARAELERSTRIVGRTAAVQEVLEKIALFAPVSSTVLIEGESGTGKELIARAIHARSPRAGQPFIAVNCAALTETLLESELFGHERGAFTGAVAQRKGRFELADRGTLFLDEAGEMPPATQVKLLRAVEERELLRVGGTQPVYVDVRVIAATNKNLREAVEHGEFRRDLYYRLNVLHIRVPPLRERREDIPLLAQRFALEFARQQGREPLTFTEPAMAILQNYEWPGNVRELRNQVERLAVLVGTRPIEPGDIPAHIYDRANPMRLLPVAAALEGPQREAAEREFIVRSLFELKRDLTEIRSLLEDGGLPGLLGEIPISATEDGGSAPASALEEARNVRRPVELPAPPAQELDDAVAPAAAAAADAHSGSLGFRVGMSLEALEREAIRLTLADVGGNRRKAARVLGIGERTLYRKLKEYDLA